MSQQPAYRPFVASAFFNDGGSARPSVYGTVPRRLPDDDEVEVPFKIGPLYIKTLPYAPTLEVMSRGRERFDIHCAPCHGRTGDGNGIVVRRGFSPPPSLHAADVRDQPVGFYFDVITNGYGAMAGYASQVRTRDRWAIIAYIRALQLSQHATMDDVPADQKSRLTNAEVLK